MPQNLTEEEYTDRREYTADGQLVEETIDFTKMPKPTAEDPDPAPEPDNGQGGDTGPTVPPADPPPPPDTGG